MEQVFPVFIVADIYQMEEKISFRLVLLFWNANIRQFLFFTIDNL